MPHAESAPGAGGNPPARGVECARYLVQAQVAPMDVQVVLLSHFGALFVGTHACEVLGDLRGRVDFPDCLGPVRVITGTCDARATGLDLRLRWIIATLLPESLRVHQLYRSFGTLQVQRSMCPIGTAVGLRDDRR